MKFQCLLFTSSVALAESGFWGFLGTGHTRLGLEASSGFLRSTRKAIGLQVERPSAEEVASAVAADGAEDAIVLMQQEAMAVLGQPKASNPARFPTDLLSSATKKLEEPPVEPLVLDSSSLSGNATVGKEPRVSATEKWEEIKSAQEEAKKAVTEGADLLKDDSVKHLMSWEAMLISNIATGDDEHAQPCIAHCRYGEDVRHSWEECVDRCVEDGMTRRMLLVGLPESERAAVKMTAAAPAGIDELKKKRAARKRARSEDL